jgi:hypothetical protein
MRTKARAAQLLIVVAVASVLLGVRDQGKARSDLRARVTSSGLGSARVLGLKYQQWEEQYLKQGGDGNVLIGLGWFKGLSTEFTEARGTAVIDLLDGRVNVRVNGLADRSRWDVWVVETASGYGHSMIPDKPSKMIRVGGMTCRGSLASLSSKLGVEEMSQLEPDLLVVTHEGADPTQDRVLMGTTTLFHHLFWSKRKPRVADLRPEHEGMSAEGLNLVSRLLGLSGSTVWAQGPIPNPAGDLEALITKGRDLFLHETFNGNGRTCASCHRENNNMTINPKFIATLPPNDPLFVAEFNPDLAVNFENPRLMRGFGLIQVNKDGFDDLANRFVMRGVPHTLALISSSLTPTILDGTTVPPLNRLGWAGDGAPGGGTLREFAIGAIIQHFPRTLKRSPGVDFRLPSRDELDAIEAFLRSLGRSENPDLAKMKMKASLTETGRNLFTDRNTGKCFFCHSNAGAGIDSGPLQGVNANFNTGVENFNNPATAAGERIPRDGGFGHTPNHDGSFGDGTFNTPPLVEAPETTPLFHNNSANTIEEAVDFHNSSAFNTSPIPRGLKIHLDPDQVKAIGAFLRVLNALENIRSSMDLETRAGEATDRSQVSELLSLANNQLQFGIDILGEAALHPDAVAAMQTALSINNSAADTDDASVRLQLIQSAIREGKAARKMMVRVQP